MMTGEGRDGWAEGKMVVRRGEWDRGRERDGHLCCQECKVFLLDLDDLFLQFRHLVAQVGHLALLAVDYPADGCGQRQNCASNSLTCHLHLDNLTMGLTLEIRFSPQAMEDNGVCFGSNSKMVVCVERLQASSDLIPSS